MRYSVYARSIKDAESLVRDRGWVSADWVFIYFDIDEPFARIRERNKVA